MGKYFEGDLRVYDGTFSADKIINTVVNSKEYVLLSDGSVDKITNLVVKSASYSGTASYATNANNADSLGGHNASSYLLKDTADNIYVSYGVFNSSITQLNNNISTNSSKIAG